MRPLQMSPMNRTSPIAPPRGLSTPVGLESQRPTGLHHALFDGRLWTCFALCAVVGCAAPQRHNSVQFLWTSGHGAAARRGVSKATVSLSPSKERRVRIAVFEDQAMQTGAMMRASVWVAATQAALAVDQDLSRWRAMVELDTNGMKVDGPSAGGLLTASFMAALQGVPVKPNVTMTGTVNPDGTIGPVGGIALKIEAAAKAGKTTVGYPTGQRIVRNPKTGKWVDVVQLGKQLGVKVVEVNDIYGAYQLITGESIVRPAPLTRGQMQVSEAVSTAVQRRTRAWTAGIDTIYRKYKSRLLPGQKVSKSWKSIVTLYGSSKRYQNEGSPMAASRDAKRAFLLADRASAVQQYIQKTQSGLDAEAKMFNRMQTGMVRKLTKLYTKLRRTKPHDEADVATLVDAFEMANQAIRDMRDGISKRRGIYRELTKARMKAKSQAQTATVPGSTSLPRAEEQKFRIQLYAPMSKLTKSNLHLAESFGHLRFRDTSSAPKGVRAVHIKRLADGLRGAARANLAYFEATVLSPKAEAQGISTAQMRGRWRGQTYHSAVLAPDVRRTNAKLLKPTSSVAYAIADLASAIHVYHAGASLVAQHYSLRLKGREGGFTGVGRRKAFTNMLDKAELAARQHAARCQQITGKVPVAAQLSYQLARDIRDSPSINDKFDALKAFWRSSLHSRLVVMLHRLAAHEEAGDA